MYEGAEKVSFIQRIRQLFSSSEEPKSDMQEETVKQVDDGYVDLPEYIAADPADYKLVSTIATVIAAGDRPESEFKVTDVKIKNPEFTKVAVIMSSIVAADMEDSSWKITNIKKRGI